MGDPVLPSHRSSKRAGMRAYNERLAISMIRLHQPLPKAEIARLTGLSPQAVSVIVRRLEMEGLVRKGAPVRGRVGQPQQPFSLNPAGAYAIGLKVGRRSSNILALDFAGQIEARLDHVHRFPTPEAVMKVARDGLGHIGKSLATAKRKRIVGVGIATPFEMWNWEQEVGAPKGVLDSWRGFDLLEEVQRLSDWPVTLCNDATAACAAELFFGQGRGFAQYAYFYIGFFIGGGIVLNGELYQGTRRYSGAMGPLLIPGPNGPEQLIRHASTYVLEREWAAAGRDPLQLTTSPEVWNLDEHMVQEWITATAQSLAWAAISAAAIVDFEAIIIDGSVPAPVRAEIVAQTQAAFEAIDHRGIAPLRILEGRIGADARAMGGAALSLLGTFGIEKDVLLKPTTA